MPAPRTGLFSPQISQTACQPGISDISDRKSQFALEFCRRRHETLNYSTFWVESQTLESLRNSFRYIAKQLRIDATDPIASVTKWFRNAPKSLVVYDNVESLEILNGFIPSGT